jgi:transposase-like protein
MTNLRAGGEKAALQNGGIVSVVVIIAVGVNLDGRREILVRAIGLQRADARRDFRTGFASRRAVIVGEVTGRLPYP